MLNSNKRTDSHGMSFPKAKVLFKRATAVVLSAVMLSGMATTAFAAAKDEQPNTDMQSMLATGGKMYPDGAFGILYPQLNMIEGGEDDTITIVRMGSTKGEATVDFHAVDVTSKYGEDYELYIDDGFFGDRKLEPAKGSKSLMETNGDNFAVTNSAELSKVAAETSATADKQGEVTTQSTEGLTELEKAQVAQTGSLQKNKGWREVTDEKTQEYKEYQEVMTKGAEETEQVIKELGGITETLTFAEGETSKEIRVHIPNDDKSNGSAQVFFALTDPKNAKLSESKTGYINITDDEKAENAQYEFDKKTVKADASEGEVRITLKRTKGTENISVANVVTADGTAVAGVDYEEAVNTLIFPKGATEKTFVIKLTGDTAEDGKYFFVGAGNEAGKLDDETGLVKVEITPNKNAEAKYTEDKNNLYERVYTFSTSETKAEYKTIHTSAESGYVTGIDLRNVYKVQAELEFDGNGKQEWYVFFHAFENSTKRFGCYFQKQHAVLKSGTENTAGTRTYEYTFPEDELSRLKLYSDFRIKVRVNDHKGWGAEDAGYVYMKKLKVFYKKIDIKPNYYNEENFYTPKIYNGTNQYTDGDMMLMGRVQTTVADFGHPDSSFKLNFTYQTNKNSAGVVPSAKNTDFEGLFVDDVNIGKGGTYNVFDAKIKSITDNMKDGSILSIYPKIKPKKVTIKFSNGDGKAKFLGYNDGDTIEVTTLDVVNLKAYPTDSQYGVSGFSAVCDNKPLTVQTTSESPDSGVLVFSDEMSVGNKTVVITPLAEKSTLTIMPHPNAKNVGKGIVSYTPDPNGSEVIAGSTEGQKLVINNIVAGKEYNIIGIGNNNKYIAEWKDGTADVNGDGEFTIAELEAYYGKDYKGKVDGSMGTSFPYKVTTPGAKKIYYQFTPVDEEEANDKVRIFGKTKLTQKDIFPKNSKPYTTALDGVSVAGADDTYTSGMDPDGKTKNPGFFQLKGSMLNVFRKFYVSANYKYSDDATLYLGVSAMPDQEQEFNFNSEENRVMDVVSAKLEKYKKAVIEGGKITAKAGYYDITSELNGLTNKDTKFKYTFDIVSKVTSLQPAKVTLIFRDIVGTEVPDTRVTRTMEEEEKEDDYANGTFRIEFNPKDIPVGSSVSVLIEDQLGNIYPEMPTGHRVLEELGFMEVSASLGWASFITAPLAIVGTLQGSGGNNWSGDASDSPYLSKDVVDFDSTEHRKMIKATLNDEVDLLTESINSETDANNKKIKEAALTRLKAQLRNNRLNTLTLSLGIATKKDAVKNNTVTGDSMAVRTSEKVKADKDVAKAVEAVAKETDAAKKTKLEQELAEKEQKALEADTNYKTALENDVKPQKTTKELAKSLKFGASFTMSLTFNYDEVYDAYYFDRMVMVFKIDGEFAMDWKFLTPVGITINVGFKVSGNVGITMMVQDKIDSKKFYISSSPTDVDFGTVAERREGKVDFFGESFMGTDVSEYDAAIFLNPSITAYAGISKGSFSIKVTGTVDIKANFTTEKDVKCTASLGASIKIEVSAFIFSASWTFQTPTWYLLGGESKDIGDELNSDKNLTMLYGDSDRFITVDNSYTKSRKGWQGDKPVSAKSLDENPDGVAEQQLQEKLLSDAVVDIEKINNSGDYLGVFTDVDNTRKDEANKKAVYYSVYDSSNGTWSKPVMLENDGTFDDKPVITDLGSRGLFITWNTASKALSDDMDKTEILNSIDIHGAFFSKSDKSFTSKNGKIDIINITNDGEEVLTSDIDCAVAVNDASMIVYYTKNKYSISNETEGEAVGDVVYPERSYRVYREYNFSGETGTAGAFVDKYDDLKDKSIAENIKKSVNDYEAYNADYYGQVFMDTVPDIYIEEKMDEDGIYWAEQPTIYAGHTVTSEVTKNTDEAATGIEETTSIKGSTVPAKTAPVIVDYDTINYNDLAIFAYTVDYDNDMETVNDRDVYFQLYDFKTGKMTHPVIVTSDNKQDGNVKLSRQSYTDLEGEAQEATQLSWLSDGDILTLNISNVIKNIGEPKTAEVNGRNVEYYIIEKTEKAGYIPPETIASYKTDETEIETEDDAVEAEAEDSGKRSGVNGFDIYSTDGYDYYVWTHTTAEVKKGIDVNSSEAADPKNQFVESQIYVVGYDHSNDIKTEAVQVTSEEGANYTDVDFAVNNDGTLKALAVKAGSHLVDVDEYNKTIEANNKTLPKEEQQEKLTADNFTPFNEINKEKELVALDIKPVSVVKIYKADDILTGAVAGQENGFEIPLLNDGLDTVEGITVTAVDEKGNGVFEKYNKTQVKNEDGDVSETIERTTTDTVSLDGLIGGTKTMLKAVITPDKFADSATVKITVKDSNGEVIDTKTVKKFFTDELSFSEVAVEKTPQRDVFDITFDAANSGTKFSPEKTLEVGVTDGNGKDHKITDTTLRELALGDTDTITLRSVKADSKYFTEATDEDGNLVETGTFYVTDGTSRSTGTVERTATADQVKAMKAVKTFNFNRSKTVSAEKGDKVSMTGIINNQYAEDIAGVRTVTESSDPEVFRFNGESGYAEAVGTAKLTTYVLPENNKSVVSFTGTEGDSVVMAETVDNFADVPTSLIKTFTSTVEVKEPTEEPDKPVVTKDYVVKNGVTYKISGKSAVVSKSDKKAAKVTIPNTVKINGKSYKVTKINENAFKNSKKLTSVKIGANVTSIGNYAFYGCKKLTTATLGSKVKTIGTGAFQNCTALKKVAVPKSVTKIGAKAFNGCKKLSTLTIGSKVKTIGKSAFAKCTKLKKVTIPKSVTTIGATAFYKDSALKTVVFKSTKVPTIGKNAFKGIAKKAVFKVPAKAKKKFAKKLTAKVGVTKKMTV